MTPSAIISIIAIAIGIISIVVSVYWLGYVTALLKISEMENKKHEE